MFITRRAPFFVNGHLGPQINPVNNGATWMSALAPRRRGRPLEMSAEDLIERIRRIAGSREGLFRVHHRNSGLYSRARRSFGSWSAAVQAAGLDYREALNGARLRSIRTRRRRSRRRRRRARSLRRPDEARPRAA